MGYIYIIFYFFISTIYKLMVNCWFGLVVWDLNRGTPKNPNPFHFRGFQESKPPGPKPTIKHWLNLVSFGPRNLPPTPKILRTIWITRVHQPKTRSAGVLRRSCLKWSYKRYKWPKIHGYITGAGIIKLSHLGLIKVDTNVS